MNHKQKTAEWILRIGIFGTFLGHGMFGLGLKLSWIPYLTTVGFSESVATTVNETLGTRTISAGFHTTFEFSMTNIGRTAIYPPIQQVQYERNLLRLV